MAPRSTKYGRRQLSDSEDDEGGDILSAMGLEKALSRRYTVNVTAGHRASKRVRFEEEDDQVVQKTPNIITIGDQQVEVDLLADAVASFTNTSNGADTSAEHANRGDHEDKNTLEEGDPDDDLLNAEVDDLLLSFGPQLNLEEDDDDDDIDPTNVVDLSDLEVEDEKVSCITI